jgi:N-carbamoyl-L-amino-acid hydrolase
VEKAHKLGAEYKVQFLFESISATGKAALTDQRIQDLIERKAKILGYTTKRMPSGAGHDSQEMTHIAPTGMIFIPSKGGISHSPDEFSSFEDMAKGTQLLLETILALDKENFDN